MFTNFGFWVQTSYGERWYNKKLYPRFEAACAYAKHLYTQGCTVRVFDRESNQVVWS